MAYPLVGWVNGLVNRNLRTKNHLLLQLEEIEPNINSLQMRKLQRRGVKSLAQGHGVIKCWSGTRITSGLHSEGFWTSHWYVEEKSFKGRKKAALISQMAQNFF